MYSEKKQALAAELSLKRPAVLAVSGAHNSGKTTLLEKLIPLLRARGLKVGVIKHDGHDFTPDVPGTDSFRLREAGAEGVAVFSGSRYLLTEEFRLNEQDLLALFERHGYDLVLMEGFKESGWPKIEVVRKALHWPSPQRWPTGSLHRCLHCNGGGRNHETDPYRRRGRAGALPRYHPDHPG